MRDLLYMVKICNLLLFWMYFWRILFRRQRGNIFGRCGRRWNERSWVPVGFWPPCRSGGVFTMIFFLFKTITRVYNSKKAFGPRAHRVKSFCWVNCLIKLWEDIRDGIMRKNCCSFGFCPNYLPSPQFGQLLQLFFNAKNGDLSDIQNDSLSKILLK